MKPRLLLISPDSVLCEWMSRAATEHGPAPHIASNPQDAAQWLASMELREPLAVMIDLRCGDSQVLRSWGDRHAPYSPVLTLAREGRSAGASTLVGGSECSASFAPAAPPQPRPSTFEEARSLMHRVEEEMAWLADAPDDPHSIETLVGRSVAFRGAQDQALRAAAMAGPILLSGERGTGKRLLARAIHAERGASSQSFIPISCHDLRPGTLATEPRSTRQPGAHISSLAQIGMLPHSVEGCTFYLDGIDALDRRSQDELVAFMDAAELWRLHQSGRSGVSARIVAATRQDLQAAARAGAFRADLYDRFSSAHIRVPALRERPSDILLLAEHILGLLTGRPGERLPVLTDAAKECLVSYAWPLNILELTRALRAAALRARGSAEIGLTELTLATRLMSDGVQAETASGAMAGEAGVTGATARIATLGAAGGTTFTEGLVIVELPQGGVAFDLLERAVLRAALAQTQGNVVRAARLLKLGRGSLRYRLEKHGIVQPRRRRAAKRRPRVHPQVEASLSKAS